MIFKILKWLENETKLMKLKHKIILKSNVKYNKNIKGIIFYLYKFKD